MKNNHSELIKTAYAHKVFDYIISIVVAAFFSFVISLFLTRGTIFEPENYTGKTIAIIIGSIIGFLAYTAHYTYRLVKCALVCKNQKYEYHHVKIDEIRGAGSHSCGLVADFIYHNKQYSCNVINYRCKYVHVFDCGCDIIYIIDEDNLLS